MHDIFKTLSEVKNAFPSLHARKDGFLLGEFFLQRYQSVYILLNYGVT